MVNTTKFIALLFCATGELASLIMYFSTDSWERNDLTVMSITVIIASIVWLILFLALSKILEHLLFWRKIKEAQLFDKGYEISKKDY
ncbi:MAG: hypothetical protein PHU36_09620, partial [Syntrophomonadaceae bacterium]|nr:hypothetical protein [Syntrophomonadaceae bacterium]